MKLSSNKLYNFIHYSTLLLLIHGCVYFTIKYFFKIETEYGLRPHDLQAFWQGAHVLLSPLAIFSLGLLWQNHIVKNYSTQSKKRKSGVLLVISFIVMIISGYLLQISYQEDLKEIFVYIHLIFSGLFTLIYSLHTFNKIY